MQFETETFYYWSGNLISKNKTSSANKLITTKLAILSLFFGNTIFSFEVNGYIEIYF